MNPGTPGLEALTLLVLVSLLAACTAERPPVTAEVTATASGASPTAAASPTTEPAAGRIRAAAVAGSWYPADRDELTQLIDTMLAEVRPVDGAPVGLIVPHAGYVYSGPVAATGFAQLRQGDYDVAVVIASDHQAPLSDPISVWAEGGFETPLGVVPVDSELARALVEADRRIVFDPAAHKGEHPIEIELPFLQRVCPGCEIVPVLMGDDGEESVRALTDALLAALPGRNAVVIASSDLSHYPSYDDARAVDGATLGAIETFKAARVRETTERLMARDISSLATCACGRGPILVTMQVAEGLGADTATVLRYANSGDSPQGNRDRVVGYGAVMFWRYEPPHLKEGQRQELLTLARTTIEGYLRDGTIPEYETNDPVLSRRSGVCVTLRKGGQLRGCTGHTRADLPLHEAVQRMAVQAATEDTRFPPLTAAELNDVTIEISVLSPLRRVTDTTQVQVGTHGLMIVKGGHRGLLLPQVPVQQGWERKRYLENLCEKAGLAAGCWQEGATLYSFTAVVFGD